MHLIQETLFEKYFIRSFATINCMVIKMWVGFVWPVYRDGIVYRIKDLEHSLISKI